MPSGKTHDRITFWSLPLAAGVAYAVTRHPMWTLLLAGGYLFGGLMFGPDLDIHSVQYKRWGYLRWIWLPYRASMPHRSPLSHGPILGTVLRLLYLGLWLGFLTLSAIALLNVMGFTGVTHASVGDAIERSLRQYLPEWMALLIGVELGAMSHSMSDWTNSTYKRVRKQGWSGFWPKRKVPKRSPRRSSGAARPRSKR